MTHYPIRHLAMPVLLAFSLCAFAQEELPNEKAETLSGKKVEFPVVMYGSIATCVFGFGNDSADRVGVWLESLSSENVNAWTAVNLESVPSVARGALRMSMRRGTPKDLLERSLILSKNTKEWKRLIDAQKDSLPTLVLFDKLGRIVWKKQGTFSAAIMDELKAQIALLSAAK